MSAARRSRWCTSTAADGLTLYHADLYRLERAATDDLGLEELHRGVLAIEWPDRLTHALPGARHIVIEILDDDRRRISWYGRAARTDSPRYRRTTSTPSGSSALPS